MGTYGTYTGVMRWYDKVNRKGHQLVLKDGEVQTDITGDYWASGATGYDEGNGFWLDRQFTPGTTIAAGEPVGLLLALTYAAEVTSPATGVTRLFFGDSGGNKVKWDGSELVIVGNITATSGSFGGWTINSTYLAKDTGTNATSAGMAPLDYPFYAGATYANRANGTFRVTPAGAVHMESGDIGGWSISTAAVYKDGATAATSAGLAPADYPFYAGAAYANRASAITRIATSGEAYFSYLDSNNYVRFRAATGTSEILKVRSTNADDYGIYLDLDFAVFGVYLSMTGSTTENAAQGIGANVFANKTGQEARALYGAIYENSKSSCDLAGVYGEVVAYLEPSASAIYGKVGGVGGVGWAGTFEGPTQILDSYLQFSGEISDPAAPAANYARLYVKDNGSGKTQLCVRFSSGAVQVIATQP